MTPLKLFAFGRGFYAAYYGDDMYDQLTADEYTSWKSKGVPAVAAVPNAKV